MNNQLGKKLKQWISQNISTEEVAQRFLARANQGKLTRDENKETHFCVYFAANDPVAKEVFMGKHKKSGLWLFNGGHIDKGEAPEQALDREIGEEWGLDIPADRIGRPLLLTITYIDNPGKQPCRIHYDIWHFVHVKRDNFNPDQEKLAKEFYETKWLSSSAANSLVTDPGTLEALDKLEKLWK